MEEVRIQVPPSNPNNLNQLNKVDGKLEEKLSGDAATKSEFMSRICQKMMPTESLYYSCSVAASTDSGLTETTTVEAVGHSSSLKSQSTSIYLHNSMDNPVGQGVQSSTLANTNRELPSSQPLQQMVSQQHQQLRQQLLKQKVQQPIIQPSSMQSNIQHCHHHHQEQQLMSSQPAQLQSSQQPIFTTLQDQQRVGQLSNGTILQQSQQLGLQNNVLEKQQQLSLPLYQHNMSTSFQQPLGLQSNVSGRQQQQQMLLPQSDALKMWTHQNPLPILQQSEITAAQIKVQQTSQPMQLRQLLGSQNHINSLQEDMQQRIQTSAALLHPQSVIINQQNRLHQLQRVLPESSSASVDSTAQTEDASSANWHDKAYQQLQSMREMYLPEVLKLYRRASELCLQATNSESATKYEKTRIFIEKITMFLQLPRADIVHCSKEKFNHFLKVIIWYLNSVRSKNLDSLQHHGKHQPPGSQSRITQLQQERSMKLQFHPVNPGSTSTPINSPQFSTQQGVSNSQPDMLNSLYNGSLGQPEQRIDLSPLQQRWAGPIHQNSGSRPQQINTISSLHNDFQSGLEQRNALSPLQHGSVRSVQNTLSSRQQTNSSHKTTVNALDPTISSIPSCSSISSFQHMKQQPKHQMMQTQKLKQPMQQPLIEQRKQHMLMRMYEGNDSKVKSISPRALSASIRDIESVFSMIDRIAERPEATASNSESRLAIGEDLVADTRYHVQARNCSLQYESSSERRMKRQISTMALDALSLPFSDNDSFKQFSGQTSDMESTATSKFKRPRIETNNALLDEIKEINQQLVETVIDVVLDSTEDAATAGSGEGTIVMCSYSALGLGEKFKLQYASSRMMSILPMRLLIPADYPNSSPIILDSFPVGWSEEWEDLSEKAKSRFSISLRKLSQPISLGGMAKTWDVCARAVFSEFTQRLGGECFSSRYGMWENCITAS